MFGLSQNSVKHMKGIHPELQFIVVEAIKDSPIDFGIPEDGGVRTDERQNEMFLDPEIKTNCDGYRRRGNHQILPGEHGKALDFYAYINGRASWADHHMSMVGAIILATAKRLKREGKIKIDIKWGGTFGSNEFNGWDKPHIEVVGS